MFILKKKIVLQFSFSKNIVWVNSHKRVKRILTLSPYFDIIAVAYTYKIVNLVMGVNIDKIKKEFPKIARESNIKLALLFGSQVTGKIHKESDVDIAIFTKKSISPMELARLNFTISEKLKTDKIELVDLRCATPFLLKQIALKSILLFEEKLGIYDDFRVYSFKLYMEAKPLYELRYKSLNNYLKNYA